MIRFGNVSKQYEGSGEEIFHDLNLLIRQGEFVLLTGKSGIGKSTLIRILLKDTDINAGNVWVQGRDIGSITKKEEPDYRRKLGIVFQDTRLIPEKTVYGNVELARIITGGKRKDNRRIISSLFTLLGITHLYNRHPQELSGGEKQKVGLARALVNYPPILLADEPTGNLSPRESREIMGLFELVHQQGITVVVATHDREIAEGLEYREIAL